MSAPPATREEQQAQLTAAYAHCAAINAEHGKSYHLATRLLTADRRPAVHALYAAARTADDLVDLPGPDPAGDLAEWSRAVLAELDKYYPGAKGYEVAGFFFWQGERDCGSPVLSARYEQNLVRFIKQVRKDFDAPDAKFVLATLGEAKKGVGGNTETVMDAQFAVDGNSGKYPEFKGNVATVFTNPMAQGGNGNGHYGKNAEVYMDVGEAMGRAMVELLAK